MAGFNPLGAVQEGYDFAQGLRDRRTMNQAGNALAGGDYRGGANALMQGGMIDQGLGLMAYDQRNQQAQAEALKAREQEAKAVTVGHMKTLLQSAQGLRQLPPEARRQAYETQVKPILIQMGIDRDPQGQQMLARWEQIQFTDGELDPFITTLGGELQKPEYQVVTPGGGRQPFAVEKGNPRNFMPVGPEQAPEREVVEGPDGLYERQADGSWKRVAKFGAAPKVFAPRAPRGGGGGSSGGGRSLGSGAEPNWD